MFKAPAQENISTLPLKPLNLFKHQAQEKQILIFCTDSTRSFWMRKNQDDQDWKEVLVNSHHRDRDGGSITFKFKEEEYNELYISSPLYLETSYISGDSELKYKLKRIPLSIRNLEKIGITKQVELDLSETIADAEKKQKETDESKRKNLLRLAQHDLLGFFDALSKDSEEVSEPGASSTSEQLAKGLSQLKM